MSSFMDFYNQKSAEIALDEVLEAREEFIEELKTLDAMAFLLKYYIETGEMLDPLVFGIDPPDEDDEDE